jgi:hypothetical protein
MAMPPTMRILKVTGGIRNRREKMKHDETRKYRVYWSWFCKTYVMSLLRYRRSDNEKTMFVGTRAQCAHWIAYNR